jgi:aminoglycoside phosphotransferase (APT) family kinase protein
MSNTSPSLAQIQSWVNTMRPHWIRCQGNIHNDPKFWNECIHSRDDIWGAVIDFYCEVRGNPDVDRKHPHLVEDLATIDQRQTRGERITIPYNKQGYNKPVFRATMAIKDVFCELTGQPMQDHLAEPKPKRRKPTHEEILAKHEELGRMLKDLFE